MDTPACLHHYAPRGVVPTQHLNERVLRGTRVHDAQTSASSPTTCGHRSRQVASTREEECRRLKLLVRERRGRRGGGGRGRRRRRLRVGCTGAVLVRRAGGLLVRVHGLHLRDQRVLRRLAHTDESAQRARPLRELLGLGAVDEDREDDQADADAERHRDLEAKERP